MTGVVQRIYKDKGYAFIRNEHNGVDYFMHRSALKNISFEELEEGREVEFEDNESAKGPRAEDVYV